MASLCDLFLALRGRGTNGRRMLRSSNFKERVVQKISDHAWHNWRIML